MRLPVWLRRIAPRAGDPRVHALLLGACLIAAFASRGLAGPPASQRAYVPGTGNATESFYDQITRGVIRLEYMEPFTYADETRWIPRSAGTAFFAFYQSKLYLVSARHVVDVPYDLRARVPSRRLKDGRTEVVELRLPADAWVFHPRAGGELADGEFVGPVDVAVAPLPWIQDRFVKGVIYCPDPCEGDLSDQFAAKDPAPPTMVLQIGFPLELGFELEEQRPMARLGIVAMSVGKHLVKAGDEYLDERSVLIDVPVLAGDSGSPVFSHPQPQGRFELMGLVTASNPEFGYAVAEPVSRIGETLEAAGKRTAAKPGSWHLLDARMAAPRTDRRPKDTVPEGAAPEGAAPEDAAPGRPALKGPVPTDPGMESPTPESAASGSRMPKQLRRSIRKGLRKRGES